MQISSLQHSSSMWIDNAPLSCQTDLTNAPSRVKKSNCNATLLKICRIALAVLIVIGTLGMVLLCKRGWKFLKEDVLKETNAIKQIFHKEEEPALSGVATASTQQQDPAIKLSSSEKNKLDETVIKQDIESILQHHPLWRADMTEWQSIKLEDQLWILNIFDLHLFLSLKTETLKGISPLADILAQDQTLPLSLAKVNKALLARQEIEVFLKSVTDVNCNIMGPARCPKAISLLENLTHLSFMGTQLTDPLDVSKNRNLEEIKLMKNGLKTAPDLTNNTKLKKVLIWANPIKVPPDLRQNPELIELNLSTNLLELPPDISCNTKLTSLCLRNNRLTAHPVTSGNPLLEILDLSSNQLTSLSDLSANINLKELAAWDNQLESIPNLSKNAFLQEIALGSNNITRLPDISNLHKLTKLHLYKNKIDVFPDISKNFELKEVVLSNNTILEVPDLGYLKKLKKLSLEKNPLSSNAKAKLVALEKACPTLYIEQ